jgi:general secretion pathway protein I
VSRARGFTLLEVLVALMLFAAVGGTLLALFQGGLRATSLGDDYTRAAMLAQSKLNELQAYRTLLPGVYEAPFDDRFSWRVTLTGRETDNDRRRAGVVPMDVVLAVYWEHGGDRREVTVDTLLLSSAEPL